MSKLYETALAFLRRKLEARGRGGAEAFIADLGTNRATLYRVLNQGKRTYADDFLTWIERLGGTLSLPVEQEAGQRATAGQTAPLPGVSSLDESMRHDLALRIPGRNVWLVAEKAFPHLPKADRERLVQEVLDGTRPLTVGLFYALAQACVDFKPGVYLDSCVASLASGAAAMGTVRESERPDTPLLSGSHYLVQETEQRYPAQPATDADTFITRTRRQKKSG